MSGFVGFLKVKGLRYATALLGLALIATVTGGFTDRSALWGVFGIAIALVAVGTADAIYSALNRRWVTMSIGIVTALFAGWLMAATFDYQSQSVAWIVPIGAGALELLALTSVPVPKLRFKITRLEEEAGEERREEYAA